MDADNIASTTTDDEYAAEAAAARRGPACAVRTAILELPPDDARRLVEALDRPIAVQPHTSIFNVLRRKLAHPPSSDSIGRHRRGICACSR